MELWYILIMGNAGFCPSTVRTVIRRIKKITINFFECIVQTVKQREKILKSDMFDSWREEMVSRKAMEREEAEL